MAQNFRGLESHPPIDQRGVLLRISGFRVSSKANVIVLTTHLLPTTRR